MRENNVFIQFLKNTWASILSPERPDLKNLYEEFVNILQTDIPADIEAYLKQKNEYEKKLLWNTCYEKEVEFLRLIRTVPVLKTLTREGLDLTQSAMTPEEKALEFTQNVWLKPPRWRHPKSVLEAFMDDQLCSQRLHIVKELIYMGADTSYNIEKEKKQLNEHQKQISAHNEAIDSDMLSPQNKNIYLVSHLKSVPNLSDQKEKTLFRQLMSVIKKEVNKPDNEEISSKSAQILEILKILEKKNELPSVLEEIHRYFMPIMFFSEKTPSALMFFDYFLSLNPNPHYVVIDDKGHISYEKYSPLSGSGPCYKKIEPKYPKGYRRTLCQYWAASDSKKHFQLFINRYKEDQFTLKKLQQELIELKEKIKPEYLDTINTYLENIELKALVPKKNEFYLDAEKNIPVPIKKKMVNKL